MDANNLKLIMLLAVCVLESSSTSTHRSRENHACTSDCARNSVGNKVITTCPWTEHQSDGSTKIRSQACCVQPCVYSNAYNGYWCWVQYEEDEQNIFEIRSWDYCTEGVPYYILNSNQQIVQGVTD